MNVEDIENIYFISLAFLSVFITFNSNDCNLKQQKKKR